MSKILQKAKEVFEIEAQAVSELSNKLTEDFPKAVQAILECEGRLVICGMGKSGLIARKIVATMASTGTPSFFLHPGEAFHGDLGMVTKHDIFLGISNSGETEEIIKLIPAIKRNGNLFIAMSGKANSTLAKNSDFFLDISVHKEACSLQLAPTSSTTATLAMGDALSVCLMDERNFQPQDFALFHPGGSLGRKLLTKVKDKMQKENLPFVSPTDSFKNVILEMTKGKLGLAMVVSEEKLVGIITDGDLRRAWGKFSNMDGKTAQDLMTPNPRTISSETMLVEAEELLHKHKITSLVVEENDKAVGVLQLYSI
ncbi:MAG: arabinose-5-phosphate isomerase [Flammeovirgaceae bacterium]|jgi:arabinose-5-phosphate isomerase